MTASFKARGLALALTACLAAAVPAAVHAQPDGYDRDRFDSQADARRAAWEQARRDYDARYGDGAYERYYPDPDADRAAREACHREKKGNEVGGALLGGIAGAVLGSNLARGGGREGGAIIGGVGGAALGSNIAKNQTHC